MTIFTKTSNYFRVKKILDILVKSFPDGSVIKNLPYNSCQYSRFRFCPWVGKIPWRRKWLPTPVFLSGKFHGQRSLTGYSPWFTKSWTRLSDWTPPPPWLELPFWRSIKSQENEQRLNSMAEVFPTPWNAHLKVFLVI